VLCTGRRGRGADSRRPAHVRRLFREAHARQGASSCTLTTRLCMDLPPSCRYCAVPVPAVVFIAESESTAHAQVVAAGSGRVDEKTDEVVKPNVEVGSTVLYSKYSGTEFKG